MQCPHRGEDWSPIYIRQRVAKHNAMHPDEKPDPVYINQTPPLLVATTKSFAKKAEDISSHDSANPVRHRGHHCQVLARHRA